MNTLYVKKNMKTKPCGQTDQIYGRIDRTWGQITKYGEKRTKIWGAD